jgi:hypothetical protein
MGEYADDAFERDWHNQFGDEEEDVVTSQEPNLLEFKSIKAETSKAWLFEMNGGAIRWLPKSQCYIAGTFVHVPRWLELKILFG